MIYIAYRKQWWLLGFFLFYEIKIKNLGKLEKSTVIHILLMVVVANEFHLFARRDVK